MTDKSFWFEGPDRCDRVGLLPRATIVVEGSAYTRSPGVVTFNLSNGDPKPKDKLNWALGRDSRWIPAWLWLERNDPRFHRQREAARKAKIAALVERKRAGDATAIEELRKLHTV